MKRAWVMDAGRFDRWLFLESKTQVPDGLGGFTKVFKTAGNLWAHIRPVSTRRVSRGDNLFSQTTHEVLIRHTDRVVAGMRFVTGSRRFDILHVRDVDETERYLVCECQERLP